VPETIKGRIVMKDVVFSYPTRPEHNVYDNLNLTIEAGQTVAFVGPSGCGKSTAVQLFERFYDPNSGSILIDGVDMKELRVSWLRQQIGNFFARLFFIFPSNY
jgi:ATP-binding cassette subfamily B (MDR/TAP) protein 1